MKYLLKLVVSLLLTGCVTAAQAGNLVEVRVRDRSTGQDQPVYRHHGKFYIAGNPGHQYSLILRNKTGGRILTVASIDGLNVINGEVASPNQTGYVLGSYGQTEITGWRKSTAEVAAFVFTDLSDSYAARTGRPQNVGVIGVAVYCERTAPRPLIAPQSSPPLERDSSDAAGTMSERSAAPMFKSERLGTGHGERETSPVAYTDFERASRYPKETIKIYYDSYQNLVARGVISRHSPEPNPFPVPVGFVPDP